MRELFEVGIPIDSCAKTAPPGELTGLAPVLLHAPTLGWAGWPRIRISKQTLPWLVVPIERIAEFVDEPAYGVLVVEPL